MKTYVVIEDDAGNKVELSMEQAMGLFAPPAPLSMTTVCRPTLSPPITFYAQDYMRPRWEFTC